MESKNKVFVLVEGGSGVIKYHRDGYFHGPEEGDGAVAMFETSADARRALQQVERNSALLTAVPRKKLYIMDNARHGYSETCEPSALPKGHRALSPKEIANERKFAAGPRTVDFKAQEEEHAAAKLPEMERSLIAEFAERCKMGFKEYGPVYLGKRNWGKELKEEALDGLFYALMAAKTMEKYGDFIKALEEASDDDLSMDACSPDPLKQAAYLVKKYASELEASEKHVSFLKTELERRRYEYDSLKKDLASTRNRMEDEYKRCLDARQACHEKVIQFNKALEDEREAKRIAEASSQKTVSELVAQRDKAEAQAEDLSERIVPALNAELAAAILRCTSLEAAATRWKEDANRYFKEAQHLRAASCAKQHVVGRPR